MSHRYTRGTAVKWKWGEGWGRGKGVERSTSKVSKSLAGTEVTRKASEESPAYLIEQDDGDQVLKAHSELKKDESP